MQLMSEPHSNVSPYNQLKFRQIILPTRGLVRLAILLSGIFLFVYAQADANNVNNNAKEAIWLERLQQGQVSDYWIDISDNAKVVITHKDLERIRQFITSTRTTA